jgi:nicotinate-nucleotide adenylyltransferase
MRPGVSGDDVQAVRERLGAGDRIVQFALEPIPISSSQIRERVARGEAIEELVPPRVAEAISRLGLYAEPE